MKIFRFDIKETLEAVIGYKGLPFPGAYQKQETITYTPKYEVPEGEEVKTHSNKGAQLRRQDALGLWYFMPVYLESDRLGIEVPNAVMSVTCEKTIVKTQLAGLEGSVKELISVNDYQFRLAGAILDEDWPEEGITALHEMFLINEPVRLQSALSDIFLDPDDKVVITRIDYPENRGIEQVQTFTMDLLSDKPFNLILE